MKTPKWLPWAVIAGAGLYLGYLLYDTLKKANQAATDAVGLTGELKGIGGDVKAAGDLVTQLSALGTDVGKIFKGNS